MVAPLRLSSGRVISPELVEAQQQDPALQEICITRIFTIEKLNVI